MLKKYNLCRQSTALAKFSNTVLHKKLKLVTAKVSDLKSKNAALQMELVILSKTHVETAAELAKDPREWRDDLGSKTRECDALNAKVDKLKKRLTTLRDMPKANEGKTQGLEMKVAWDATARAHLAKLENDQRSNVFT